MAGSDESVESGTRSEQAAKKNLKLAGAAAKAEYDAHEARKQERQKRDQESLKRMQKEADKANREERERIAKGGRPVIGHPDGKGNTYFKKPVESFSQLGESSKKR